MEKYKALEMEVIVFDNEDIIITSDSIPLNENEDIIPIPVKP